MIARPVSDAEIDAAVARWRTEGWAVLPGVASAEVLAGLRERAEAYVAGAVPDPGIFFQAEGETGRYGDVAKVPGWVGPDRAYRKMEKLERDDRYRAWIENPLFARVVGRVIAGPVALYRAVLFTKAPRVGSDTPWHQDGGRLWGLDRDPEIQLWTALDDAPPDAGCLEVVPGSHHDGLATPLGGVVPDANVAAADAERRAVAIPARAGDVVLLHNLAWHRSGPNTTDVVRRGFTACYLPADTRCVRTKKAPRSFPRVFG